MAGKSVNEVRKDIMGRKTVITAIRSDRPQDHASPARVEKSLPPEKCFFCPGNEKLTPPELDRIESAYGKWQIRCFPNKFPAFSPASPKAYGRHEVIVETPDHKKSLSELSVDNLVNYLTMVQKRMNVARQDSKIAYTVVFKNEGKLGGASLEHSHTQVVSFGEVPDYVKKLTKKTDDFSKLEKSHAKNIFAQNAHFFAFCPKASRFHLESWIAPKRPVPSILKLDAGQLRSLAEILKSALSALDATSGFGPYNIIFHSSPCDESNFPFHIQILPRLSTWAGFELGTDMVMLSQLPEDTAKKFKEFLVSPPMKNED